MRRVLACTALLAIVAVGCSSSQVFRVPPRIDLARHELIGVIEFSSTSEGELGALATRRFMESARQDQGLVRVLEVGPAQQALGSVGRDRLDAETFRALGQQHELRTVVVGELTVSKVRPSVRIDPDLRSGGLSARVDATLAVQMIETETGASIWSRSARATQSVGQISVLGGDRIVFDADDPERAYGGLVDALVAQVTRDFQVGWERR